MTYILAHMLPGGSPQSSGFEVTGRAPLDYKSVATSIENMLATPAKYEGMQVYVRKGADPLTGTTYRLKSLAENGLSNAQIALWGTLLGHWKAEAGAAADLTPFTRNDTGETTLPITVAPENGSLVTLDPSGKGSLQSLFNQVLALLTTLFSRPPAVTSINNVLPDATGNVNTGDGLSSGSGVFAPVATLAALKAIDITDATVWKDKWLINVQDTNLFYLDRQSTLLPDDSLVVIPDNITHPAPGRWIRRVTLPGVTYDVSGEMTMAYTPADSSNTTGFFAGLLTLGKLSPKPALDRMVERIKAKPDAQIYSSCHFVTPAGNDATALANRMDRPFKTIAAANAVANNGHTVFVYPGTYNEQNVIKNFVNYHFFHGAVVSPGNGLSCISDAGGAIISTIRGMGQFAGLGYGVNNSTAISLTNASIVDIECLRVDSVSCANVNARLTIRNASITFELNARSGGIVTLDRCRVFDCVTTIFSTGMLRARRTHFENTIRQHANYGLPAISGSLGYVTERSPVITNICMGTGQNGSGAGRLMLDDCTMVSQHENVTFINSNHSVAHKNTNMFVTLENAGQVFGSETIVPTSYRNRVAAIQPVSFMGISYVNADVTPLFVHNNLFGPGLSVEPALEKIFLLNA